MIDFIIFSLQNNPRLTRISKNPLSNRLRQSSSSYLCGNSGTKMFSKKYLNKIRFTSAATKVIRAGVPN